jgi:hypothetical protein
VEAVKHVATSGLNKLNTQKETLAEQTDIAIAKGQGRRSGCAAGFSRNHSGEHEYAET